MSLTRRLATLLLLAALASGMLTTLSSCTNSTPKPGQQELQTFIVHVEQKYKREAYRNPIDLHFVSPEENRLQIRVTYDKTADPALARSIAESAVELVQRLKREDPTVKDVPLTIEKDVKARD